MRTNHTGGTCSLALMMIGATLYLASCGQPEDTDQASASGTNQAQVYTIATTVGMVADIVKNVTGEHAVVSNIIGEGVDPHLYSPTRADVVALTQADIVFYSGLHLEGKMTDIFAKIAKTGKPVFPVTSKLGDPYLIKGFHAEYSDPHVWMDPSGWMTAVEAVAEAMSQVDPAHADEYQANAAAYVSELKKLDAYAKASMATIPESSRVLVTAHDAFGYMGRAFGLEVQGIQGISTESEAGLKDVNRLVDLLVDRQIGAIFVETSVAEKNVRALIDGARSRSKTVKIGGSLFSDAMGKKGTYEGTYIGMIDHNVTVIVRALGGEAPVNGMQGKLNAAKEGL